MGKKYKQTLLKGGKKVKKGKELTADELVIARKTGKQVCFRMLQLLAWVLILMGVSMAYQRDDIRMTARKLDCSGAGLADCNSTSYTVDESLAAVFNTLDLDGNGRLDRGEINQGADGLGRPLTPSGLEATMVEMDKDLSGDIDLEEWKQERWPVLWMLGGVAMLVLAYCIGGLVGGKKEEQLTFSTKEEQWSVCLAEVSWGRVQTSSTVYSVRRDVIARVGQSVGRKITAYAVYMFVEGELLPDGSRKEVRIWSGNKQRAEQVCKTINRFFHGKAEKRGWKSVLATVSSGAAKAGQQPGQTDRFKDLDRQKDKFVRFGAASLWRGQVGPVNEACPNINDQADRALRQWQDQDWAGHAPLLHAENEDSRLSLLRLELEQLSVGALRTRAQTWGLREELTLVELSVGVGNALLGSPDQALASIQSTLEHASALLRRPIHHTYLDERNEMNMRVKAILADPGDVNSGVVGAINAMRRTIFGEVYTIAERMAAVDQLDQNLAGKVKAVALCGVRTPIDYCTKCSSAFETIRQLVRALEVCMRWQYGQEFPPTRIDTWVLAGRCRNAQLRALLRSELEPVDFSPPWAAKRRRDAEELSIIATEEDDIDKAIADSIESAYETFEHVDVDGSGALTEDEMELLCHDPQLLQSFLPVGGRFENMQQGQKEEMLLGLRKRLDKDGDGMLSFEEFEDWFVTQAEAIDRNHRLEALEARQLARLQTARTVEALCSTGKDWGLELEVLGALDTVELSRTLLITHSQAHVGDAVGPLQQVLTHVQSVLRSVSRRAGKKTQLPLHHRDLLHMQQLVGAATSLDQRTDALLAELARNDLTRGVLGALRVMDMGDVLMISHRVSAATRLQDVDASVADRTQMLACVDEISGLLAALEACMSWDGEGEDLYGVSAPPPSRRAHAALAEHSGGVALPWEWSESWFVYPFSVSGAIISLLLKRSRGVGTGVRYADQQSFKIETEDIALQDGSMSSLVKLLLKRQGVAKAAAVKKEMMGPKESETFSMIDHTPRTRRLTKREVELERSKSRRSEAFNAVGAVQRAPEIAEKVALAVRAIDDLVDLNEEGQELIGTIRQQLLEQLKVHDTIFRNSAELSFSTGSQGPPPGGGAAGGSSADGGGFANASAMPTNHKEEKDRRYRFYRFIGVAQSTFHPYSGVQGMQLPTNLMSVLDPAINVPATSGMGGGGGGTHRRDRAPTSLEKALGKALGSEGGSAAKNRYVDAFMQIDPDSFNLAALSQYIRIAEDHAERSHMAYQSAYAAQIAVHTAALPEPEPEPELMSAVQQLEAQLAQMEQQPEPEPEPEPEEGGGGPTIGMATIAIAKGRARSMARGSSWAPSSLGALETAAAIAVATNAATTAGRLAYEAALQPQDDQQHGGDILHGGYYGGVSVRAMIDHMKVLQQDEIDVPLPPGAALGAKDLLPWQSVAALQRSKAVSHALASVQQGLLDKLTQLQEAEEHFALVASQAKIESTMSVAYAMVAGKKWKGTLGESVQLPTEEHGGLLISSQTNAATAALAAEEVGAPKTPRRERSMARGSSVAAALAPEPEPEPKVGRSTTPKRARSMPRGSSVAKPAEPEPEPEPEGEAVEETAAEKKKSKIAAQKAKLQAAKTFKSKTGGKKPTKKATAVAAAPGLEPEPQPQAGGTKVEVPPPLPPKVGKDMPRASTPPRTTDGTGKAVTAAERKKAVIEAKQRKKAAAAEKAEKTADAGADAAPKPPPKLEPEPESELAGTASAAGALKAKKAAAGNGTTAAGKKKRPSSVAAKKAAIAAARMKTAAAAGAGADGPKPAPSLEAPPPLGAAAPTAANQQVKAKRKASIAAKRAAMLAAKEKQKQ